MLPHDYPPHDTVWSFYRRAMNKGTWDKVMMYLVKVTRKKRRRNENPSYALIDSQSVKTTCYGDNHGYDGGYRGTFKNIFEEFHNLRIDISMQIKEQKGFQVIPKRWVVELTFAWLNFSRRLSKDYEVPSRSAECMIVISHTFSLLKHL